MHSHSEVTADERPAAPLPGHPGGVKHLRRGGTSVVIDLDAVPHPAIVHWGEELAGGHLTVREHGLVLTRKKREAQAVRMTDFSGRTLEFMP